VKRFQENILGCIKKYNDHLGASIWLKKAEKELDEACFVELIDSVEPELFSHDILIEYVVNKVSLETQEVALARIKSLIKNNNFDEADKYFAVSERHIDKTAYQKLKKYQIDSCGEQTKKSEEDRVLRNKIFNTQFSGLKNELQIDYCTYTNHMNTPALKKYNLEHFNVYLTKSKLSDLVVSSNRNGSYRFFSWDDTRAINLVKSDVGDNIFFDGHRSSHESNKLEVIGNFIPAGKDLTHIQYQTMTKKAYFASAISTLSNSEEKMSTKISIDSFVDMKEVIPTGAQGRAIYADNSYIVDGAAGTGKTTTVIQKILILTKHKGVEASSIYILVKNSDVENQFRTLLRNMNVEGITIISVDSFLIEKIPKDFSEKNTDFLKSTELKLKYFVGIFKSSLNNKRFLNVNNNLKESEVEVFNQFTKHTLFSSAFKKYDKSCDDLHKKRSDLSDYIKNKNDKIKLKIIDIEDRMLNDEILRIKKTSLGRGTKPSEIGIDDVSEKFIDNIPMKSKPEIEKYEHSFSNREKILSEKIQEVRLRLDFETTKLMDVFYSDSFLSMLFTNKIDCAAAVMYANKENDNTNKAHTLIVDEAQDVSKVNIELLRLISENLVLVGDEAQNENIEGVGRWENIHNNHLLLKSGDSNIHKLRHNFRQTYELGMVSYNYRQLILGHEIEDIKEDYFEDQIGFNAPMLFKVKSANDIMSVVLDKLKFIKATFTKGFPLVFVYDSNKEFYEKLFTSNSISYACDSLNEDIDVMMVHSESIAGREFPVVMVTITKDAPKQSIYIKLSRARFDLTVLVNHKYEVDDYLLMLCDRGFMSRNEEN